MRRKLKCKIARAFAGSYKLNKKVMQIKRSWDEVESILNGTYKGRKKPPGCRS